MEEIILSVLEGQGIWTVLFVFLLLYTIKKNDSLAQKQETRESEYQVLLSSLSDKYAIVSNISEEIKQLKEFIKKE
jgi:hypothetical protein